MFTQVLLTFLVLLGAARLPAVPVSGEIVFPGPFWSSGLPSAPFRLDGPNFSVQGIYEGPYAGPNVCVWACDPGNTVDVIFGFGSSSNDAQTFMSGTYNGAPISGPGIPNRDPSLGDAFTSLWDFTPVSFTLTDSFVYRIPFEPSGFLAVYEGDVCVTCTRLDYPNGTFNWVGLPISADGLAILTLRPSTFIGTYQVDSLVLQFTAVPEPSSFWFIAASLGAYLLLCRRPTRPIAGDAC